MDDAISRIRAALGNPALNVGSGSIIETHDAVWAYRMECNPTAIRAMLDERDRLRAATQAALNVLEQLQGGCTDSDDGTVEAITVWCPEIIDELRAALENTNAK